MAPKAKQCTEGSALEKENPTEQLFRIKKRGEKAQRKKRGKPTFV